MTTQTHKEHEELERRWHVTDLDPWVVKGPYRRIEQAYFDGSSDVRIRIIDAAKAELTRKTGRGKRRKERNRETDVDTARFLMDSTPYKLVKRRYVVDGWEVDVFEGALAGLILAEYETTCADELDRIIPPSWIRSSTEVTETLTNRDLARIAADLKDGETVSPTLIGQPGIPSIVVTGCPCSGKSALLKHLSGDGVHSPFPGRFFHCVPEVATIVIGQVGAHPPLDDPRANRVFQRGIYRVQRTFEAVSKLHALRTGRTALVMDRGTMDGAAYMAGGVNEFEQVARTTAADEYAHYDAVLIMMPPPRDVYEREKSNNPARFETYEQALALHERIMQAWGDCPKAHVIDGETWAQKLATASARIEATLCK